MSSPLSRIHLVIVFLLLAVVAGTYLFVRNPKAEKRDFANRDRHDTRYRKVSNVKRPFKTGGNYHMTMELRKSDLKNWLDVDENYAPLHSIRSDLLDEKKCRVLQCLPGSEAACFEVLDLVVGFLTENFPAQFKPRFSLSEIEFVEVVATKEIFQVKAPFNGLEPLEIAARLAMEDFNILIKGEDNLHNLASATLFPVGWSVQDRAGWSLARLHDVVPSWQEKVGVMVERFLSRIVPSTPMERSSFFVQVIEPGQSLSKILCQMEPMHGRVARKPRDILFRWERQVFRRLPKTGAILFSVKTDLVQLEDMTEKDLKDFAIEARSWPEEVAKYKGKHEWEDCALGFCDSM